MTMLLLVWVKSGGKPLGKCLDKYVNIHMVVISRDYGIIELWKRKILCILFPRVMSMVIHGVIHVFGLSLFKAERIDAAY